MQVMEILSTPVIGVTPDATLAEAAALLAEHGFGVLPVFGDDAGLLGVVTEQDVVCGLVTREAAEKPAQVVREVMRPATATTTPDTEVTDLPSVLLRSGLRCVPVVSETRVIGIVGWRDLLVATRHPDLAN